MSVQPQQINSVKKRNGNVVNFDESKIVSAVKRAFVASSNPFTDSTKHKIINRIYELIASDPNCNIDSEFIDIEVIQDIVEMALIKEGYRHIAKEYMLYRMEKRKIREQKKKFLEVDELTEVEKRYTLDALRIFKSRYLLIDNEGKTCERLDDLFKRVAVAAGIMEILYDEKFYDKTGCQANDFLDYKGTEKFLQEYEKTNAKQDYKYILADAPLFIGDFIINHYHVERLVARYLELVHTHNMKVPWILIWNTLVIDEEFRAKYLVKIQQYYDLLTNGVFLPNTPTMMNAGTKLGQLSACFTLGIEDSIKGIYKTKTDVAEIFMTGGGIGVNYDNLRPRGSLVKTTGGTSPGAVHFLESVDHDTGSISQGGKRRGAAMGILSAWHPDIMEFIKKKTRAKEGPLSNHNISVNFTPQFFTTFFEDKTWDLSYKGKVFRSIKARDLMDIMVNKAHECGDPGCVFEDNMNSNNLLLPVFQRPIKVTNPCSEISMYEYDSCNLASINMTKFVENGEFNLSEFMRVCSLVAQFLDNVIDANKYTLPEINEISKKCRRIGMGMMGVGYMLSMLGIPYNSLEGFTLVEYLSAMMTGEGLMTSSHLANVKGPFPYYNDPRYEINRNDLPVNAMLNKTYAKDLETRMSKITKYLSNIIMPIAYYDSIPHREYGLRNCSVTTFAPTGTLAMMVEVTSGIEPDFSLGFTKKVTVGDFYYVNRYLISALKKAGLYSDELIDKIVNEYSGKIGKMTEIPEEIRKAFVTSMEIHPYDHIMMQAIAQRWITNGISKTINAPNDISPSEIEKCYILSWALGNKGITVYRDGAKEEQVLNNNNETMHPSQTTILQASDFTIKEILHNDRLPDYYKQELIDLSDTTPTYKSYTEAAANLFKEKHKNVGICPNCDAVNTLQPNGSKGCQLCKACGHGIGSCE